MVCKHFGVPMFIHSLNFVINRLMLRLNFAETEVRARKVGMLAANMEISSWFSGKIVVGWLWLLGTLHQQRWNSNGSQKPWSIVEPQPPIPHRKVWYLVIISKKNKCTKWIHKRRNNHVWWYIICLHLRLKGSTYWCFDVFFFTFWWQPWLQYHMLHTWKTLYGFMFVYIYI